MARLGARVFLAATSLRRGKETTRQPMAWPRNFQLESIAETQPQLQPALLRLSEPPCELCSKGAGPRFTNTFGIGLRSYMQLSGDLLSIRVINNSALKDTLHKRISKRLRCIRTHQCSGVHGVAGELAGDEWAMWQG